MYIIVRGSDIAFPNTHIHTHTHTHTYIYIYIYMTDTNKFPNPPNVKTISLDGENISFDASLKEQYTIGGPLNFVPAAAVL